MFRYLIISVLIIFAAACSTPELTSQDILAKSINFHDPDGQWNHLKVEMRFNEVNPRDEVRKSSAWFDQEKGYFKLNRGDYEIHGMEMDSCFVEKGDYDCDRAKRMRDYYTYLWGLPMKLMDEGTQLSDSIREETWEGKEVYVLSVDYEKDDWEYYIEKETFQLVGYYFLQTSGNAEKIILEGLTPYGKMQFPANRSWYMTSDNNRFLATDKLVEVVSWE